MDTNAYLARNNKTYTIRWRKGTATWVIYLKGRVWESGFNTREQAIQHLETRLFHRSSMARYQGIRIGKHLVAEPLCK